MSSEQTSKESQQSLVMARQLSDFHISKIMFSPFFEDGLVSCGRENIRFWRMKKGHLPGRPVQLNEFSRGYFFTDLAYANAPPVGQEQGNILEPCVFVASSMGLLLRVDCRLEQVVCAYQLHNGPIRSLAINGSFAVTGGDDCRMRIWPLHFTDFLMEAHHEAPVTHTVVSQNNRFLTVGTASGTLGVLDVLDHRYWTVLRSHVGPVTCLSTRPPVGEEFMTLGSDHTIRLWDLVSGQQKFEFDSPQDTPLCGSYHPFAHILACGFSSGTLRVFDVQTTSTLFERSPEASLSSPIVRLVFSHANSTSADLSFSSQVRLYSLSLSGKLTAYDTNNNYLPVRTISIAGNPWDSISMNDDIKSRSASMIHLSLSKDNQFLAASCGSIGSLTIFDTTELVPIHRGTTFKKNLSMNTGYLGNDTQSLYSSSTHAQFSMTNIGNPATHVKGLLFFMEKSDRAVMGDENTLLIVTDKHFITISIPVQLNESPRTAAVLESSYAVTLTSDDVCWRRIEGGVRPVSGVITRDHPTGLVFMSIRRSGTEHHAEESQLTPLSGDALAVIGVSCKRTRDPKSLRLISRLNITPMQVITDLPGDKNILYLTPCGPASNKILASDQSGCISVWYLREDRIEQLKSHSLSHVTDSPIEEYSEASRWEAPLEMENRDKEKESLEQIDLANEFEFESENNPTDNNGDTGELKISELEQEVAKTKVEAVETLFDDVENIPQHYRSNQAKSSNSNSDNSTAKKITEMISSRLQQRKKRNSEPSSLKSCGINSGTESRDSTETNTNTNPLGATEAEEDQEWDLVDPKLCQFTAQQLPSLQRIQIKNRMPGRLLVQNCLISPAFCDSSRLLVTSNESEV